MLRRALELRNQPGSTSRQVQPQDGRKLVANAQLPALVEEMSGDFESSLAVYALNRAQISRLGQLQVRKMLLQLNEDVQCSILET